MNDLDIPTEILDAANMVTQWMRANGIAQLGGLQQRAESPNVDILQAYDGKDGRRIWSNHGVWLYPGQAVAVVDIGERGLTK